MRRMNEDRAQRQLEPLRPCQYFDFIVGSGFGGSVFHGHAQISFKSSFRFIAILLGVLGMDDQAAKGSFASVHATLGEQPDITPQQRSSRLEDITNIVLKDAGVTPTTKLFSKDASLPHCKTYVDIHRMAST